MADEVGQIREVLQIRKASWLFLGLGVFTLAVFLFGAPSTGPISTQHVTWIALIAGFVAGLGAIQCATYLRRRQLALPGITVAALAVGGVSLLISGLIVALGILRFMG